MPHCGTGHQLCSPRASRPSSRWYDERFRGEGFQEQHEYDHEHDGFHNSRQVSFARATAFWFGRHGSHGRFLSESARHPCSENEERK